MNVYKTASLIIALSASVSFLRAYTTTPSGSAQHTTDAPLTIFQNDSDQSPMDSAFETNPTDADINQSEISEEKSRFVVQEITEIDSPFTRETVLKLNAIVQRSLNAINEFDHARSSDNIYPDQRFNVYTDLSEKASSAHADMALASNKLISSNERYNEEILSAMVYFVQQVDNEIREETQQLHLAQQSQAD